MVPQRAQTQGVDDMVADIKKALGEGAREIQWWRIRHFLPEALKTKNTVYNPFFRSFFSKKYRKKLTCFFEEETSLLGTEQLSWS